MVFTVSGLLMRHLQWGAATTETGVFVHCTHIKLPTSLPSEERSNNKQINCVVHQIKGTSGANYFHTQLFTLVFRQCWFAAVH